MTSLSRTGEGNGNPLQCSCLENPRDGGAWWAAVCGVARSRTLLKRLSSSSSREAHARSAGLSKDTGPRSLFTNMYEASYPKPTMWKVHKYVCTHTHTHTHTHKRFLRRINCSNPPAAWVFPAQVTNMSEAVMMTPAPTTFAYIHMRDPRQPLN